MGVTIEIEVFEFGIFESTIGLSQEMTYLSLEKRGTRAPESYIITGYLLRVARGLATLNAVEVKIGGGAG